MLIPLQHDPRIAHDAPQEPASAGRQAPEVSIAPDHEVHLAADVIRYRIAQSTEPLPVDGPHEEHVDVAVGRIAA
jgi:hypothetical protein